MIGKVKAFCSNIFSWKLVMVYSRYVFLLMLSLSLVASVSGCAKRGPARETHRADERPSSAQGASLLGFTIQAGAFARVENAAQLTAHLNEQGIGATYFRAEGGLYKVRFGNYSSKEAALKQAERLKLDGLIDEYYVIPPSESAAVKSERLGSAYLRAELVKTARDFIGLPYLWGSANPRAGFDCSGLVVAVYQLNGVNLPRSSRELYAQGRPRRLDQIAAGDLVFFATRRGDEVSHVGIYMGNNSFIHAPGKGKHIRLDRLDDHYYRGRYLGARSFL